MTAAMQSLDELPHLSHPNDTNGEGALGLYLYNMDHHLQMWISTPKLCSKNFFDFFISLSFHCENGS